MSNPVRLQRVQRRCTNTAAEQPARADICKRGEHSHGIPRPSLRRMCGIVVAMRR